MWLTTRKDRPYLFARFLHPDGSGVIVSKSTFETRKRAAEARGAEIEAEFRREWERSRVGGKVTAKQVIEEFWESDARRLKSAVDHVFPHLARIDRFLGERAYCDVTIADVARFVDMMDGKLSDSTINRALSIWRRMHNLAAKKRLYPVQMIDWSAVRRLEPEPQDRALKAEQVRAIGEHLPYRAREIVMFAVVTGLRKSQVLGLTWDRVDQEAGTVKVYRKHRKAYALHTVNLHTRARQILAGRPRGAGGDLVFEVTNFRKDWERALAACGLRGNVRFHDLRHSFATWLAAKAPLLVVKEHLGHSDLRVTQRYAHVSREDIRTALDALPDPDP